MPLDPRNLKKIQIIKTISGSFAVLSITDSNGEVYELELGKDPNIRAHPNEENPVDIQITLDKLIETAGKTHLPLEDWIGNLFYRKNGLSSPFFHLAKFGEGGTLTLYNPGTIPYGTQDALEPAARDYSKITPVEIVKVHRAPFPERYLAGHPRLLIAGMGLLVSGSFMEKGPDGEPTIVGAVIYNPDKSIIPDMSPTSIAEFVNSKRGVRITLNALSQVTADCRVVLRIPNNSYDSEVFHERIVKPMWGETKRISIDLLDHTALSSDFPKGPPGGVNYLTEFAEKLDMAGIEYTVLYP